MVKREKNLINFLNPHHCEQTLATIIASPQSQDHNDLLRIFQTHHQLVCIRVPPKTYAGGASNYAKDRPLSPNLSFLLL